MAEKNTSISVKREQYERIVEKQGYLIVKRRKSLNLSDVMDEIIEKGLPLVD